MTISALLTQAAGILAKSSPTPLLDADCLLSAVLHTDRARILAHLDAPVPHRRADRFCALVERRKKGLPVAYLTGHKEFFALDFHVNPSVLIPKPDTETLVEKTLDFLAEVLILKPETLVEKTVSPTPLRVLDLCTGSLCVGIAVVRNAAGPVELTATDISESALRTARENARCLLSAEQRRLLHFVRADLFSGLGGRFDIIVSNPPYVPTKIAHALLADGRGEPLGALDGGEDGLALIRPLVSQAPKHLFPGGRLLIEINHDQAEAVKKCFRLAGFEKIEVFKDLQGTPRVLCGLQS